MKNRVVETDDNVVALEIIYKGTRLLCYIDKVDLPKAALIKCFYYSEKILANDVDYINSYHTFHYLHLDRYKC